MEQKCIAFYEDNGFDTVQKVSKALAIHKGVICVYLSLMSCLLVVNELFTHEFLKVLHEYRHIDCTYPSHYE